MTETPQTPQRAKFTAMDYARWVQAQAQRRETARKTRLETDPHRLARLKRAAEKRARRAAKRLQMLELK